MGAIAAGAARQKPMVSAAASHLPAAAPGGATGSAPGNADIGVLLTPRAPGGHEVALVGWLSDAVHQHGLQPWIVAPGAALRQACLAAGLGPWLATEQAGTAGEPCTRRRVLAQLRRWPAGQPLLLAPGVLHADAWLLAAAVALRHQLWVYVPMAYSARHMGCRQAALRDALLAPWLRRVRAWVTLDGRQAHWLQQHWRTSAPVHLLPNIARLPDAPQPQPRPAPDHRLRVAFVGRFDPVQKGLDWLAAMLLQHRGWAERCRWHFQGQGPGELGLLALASALGPQHVQVFGHAPIQAALAANDVLLLPSRYEGRPLVALEATALGWPVVASHSAGLHDLLPDRSLFHFGDALGLQRALDSLRRPAARVAAVAHARERLLAMRAMPRYQRALADLVRHVQAAGPGRQRAAPC